MYDEKTLIYPSENSARTTLHSGNLLIKIFSGWQPKAWPLFIYQLQNPRSRVPLRATPDPSATHKFYHLCGAVEPWGGKTTGDKPWHETHTKKTSMTLVSPKKYMPLFQSHHIASDMVGLVFRADTNLSEGDYDPDLAKIKAMLLSDSGTYHRKWRGDKATVETYAKQVRGINYSSLDAFKRRVWDKSKKTNEVLAEPSKGSILGVVIARDTPRIRAIALAYRNELREKLGLELPLMLYDSNQWSFIPDLERYEVMQKKRALEEEQNILKTMSPLTSYCFFKRNKRFEGQPYPVIVAKRLQKIAQELADLDRIQDITLSRHAVS